MRLQSLSTCASVAYSPRLSFPYSTAVSKVALVDVDKLLREVYEGDTTSRGAGRGVSKHSPCDNAGKIRNVRTGQAYLDSVQSDGQLDSFIVAGCVLMRLVSGLVSEAQ